MSSDAPGSAHKRTKSAVTKALQRLSSRGDVPTVASLKSNSASSGGAANQPDNPADMSSPNTNTPNGAADAFLSPNSMSMQSHRPHLSTTMSNTQLPQAPNSPTKDASPITPSSATQGASIEQSVRLFKVFEALRNGDTAAIAKATRADGEGKLEGTTILHLAIQCAEIPVIEYVLSQHDTHVNAKDKEGNTPLMVASSLGRVPVVKLLLEQKGINDALPNYQGKTALDMARNPDIFQLLQLARSVFIDQVIRRVHQFVGAGDYGSLENLLNEARVRTTLDVNGPELATEPATVADGGSLLHEAARKRDLKLAQLLLLNGADPFRRDRKGKLPQDVTKDDKTRAILKKSPAAAAAQRQIQEKTILGEGVQATGVPTTDAGPGSKESREIKGYLKKWTNYTSGYKLRWFVLEDGVLSYYKHQDDAGSACRGAINMRIARLQMDPKDKLHFELHGKSSVKYDLKANHQVEAKRWFWALNNAIQWAKDEAREEQRREQQEASARHEQLEKMKTRESEIAHTGGSLVQASAVSGGSTPMAGSTLGEQLSAYDPSEADAASAHGMRRISRTNTATVEGDLDDDEDYGDDASSHEIRPANKDAFSITAQSAKLQLDLLDQVLSAVHSEKQKNPDIGLSHPTVVQALSSYETAVGNLKGLLMDLLRISRDHEAFWQYRLEREQNIRRLWEDSMAKVAKEQEELETRIGESEEKRKRTRKALKEALDGSYSTAGTPQPLGEKQGKPLLDVPAVAVKRRQTIAELTNHELSDDETEDEEEFFDAVDAGEVEVLESLPSPPLDRKSPEPILTTRDGAGDDIEVERAAKEQEIARSYRGYEDGIRKRLKIDADNRPKVSLWGVLKSMIGKDMTKMTLPVTFNEPTSLLYRVVEDMEYTNLLNMAADRTDSTERLVYVAAFAASEYASTIGRVAKPFNPLLGETYEYVRPDQGYRFFIEQVSHHPPVGAAYAESAKWTYYGESSVKSKFYGKSFEFNPLGTWFCHIKPVDGGPEELYTWKKVTSSVVGILTGNPVVDQYGPMEIKNWTTGEVCYLDFKPRGWKASSAFQVSGKVVDASGKTRWSIGGRWDSKIYARLTPGYEVDVEQDAANEKKAFLVWEAHYRPPPGEIPFNLTPFAVTLNDLPDRLRPLIAPTDTRLRPDQRAMEEAQYDFAAKEKNRVEEAQRARRRVREAKGEEFVPRWFTPGKHPVTGEEYWVFNHEYWKIRDQVAAGERKWEDERLEEIF
ncbi:hypothetical protein AC579_2231 [Pseudocercospora musae]|uniref:PH domain-containing protein n=1 Tax=Pseudocercospora musae TaxID=113226 RepID=A0A139IV51_9PEZI|nr:hypothetical protein AC579_2231 [Pseudocercospora musae]KXT18518.1 hypothetical protein AC579_2231 [Pseudocercospora musae]KXT18519.1 hypothetical protein AC579_2231 [Pseudocercospora musae]KXT18520.1 hypothetical protein AC579_2231 [Pseudocercospora musae]